MHLLGKVVLVSDLVLLELLNLLEHLLHSILDGRLLFTKLRLKGSEAVCEVLDVGPRAVGLGFLDLDYDGLVVREVDVVEFSIVPEQKAAKVEGEVGDLLIRG